MLSLEADSLGREAKRAREFRAKYTVKPATIDKRGIGNWFSTDNQTSPQPENLVAAWKAFMMPALCFSAPDARITARRPSLYEGLAKGMTAAMDVWVGDSDFLEEHRSVVWDMLSGWAVMKVGLEGVSQSYGQVLRPFACRVPRDQFLIDPRCERWTDARFMGHEYFRDREDLVAEVERFDMSLADDIMDTGGNEATRGRGERAVAMQEEQDRKLVKLIDLWIPEHGVICTFIASDTGEPAKFIRPPTKYWGPDTGPYQMFQFFDIPGTPFGMSPLQTAMEQIEELNLHLTAAAEEAATAKSFWLVEAGRPEIKDAMANARRGDIVPVTALGNNVQKIETGTMSNQRIEYLTSVRDRMERILGFSAAQQGAEASASKTATEISTVQNNADQRTEWMRSKVNSATNKVLDKVLWYLFYDPSVVIPVNIQDQQTGQNAEMNYLGGQQPGQEDLHVTEFQLEIDSQSMRHTDDTAIQQRWLQFIQVFPQLVGMQQQGGNARYVTDQFGSTMNVPNMSEIVFTPQFGAMLQPAVGGQMVPPGVAALGSGQPPQSPSPQGLQPAQQSTPMPQVPPVSAPIPGQAPAFPQ